MTPNAASLTFASLSIFSAILLAASGILSKRLTLAAPPRQLIGPLLLLNAAVVAVFLPFSSWRASPTILLLLCLEAVLLVLVSRAVWDFYGSGSAGATLMAQTMSPVFAVPLTALLLPELFRVVPAIAACVIVIAVMSALSQAFTTLGRGRTFAGLMLAAFCGGSLSVTTRILGDLGVGIFPNYFARNVLGGLLALLVFRPQVLPRGLLPRLVGRTLVTVPHYLLFLAAVRVGSPAAALTVLATAPLMVFGVDAIRGEARLNPRQIVASVVVILVLPVVLSGA